MRNFSKTLISMAAVMAVGSAMAAGAMAADATASYADGVVTLTGSYATGSSQTMIVFKGAETDTTIDEENIKQIDQVDNVADGDAAFSKITVGELAEGDYVVRIGGTYDGGVKTETFTVGGAVQTKNVIPGDADENTKINALDITWIRRSTAGNEKNIGKIGTIYDKADGTGTHAVGDADDNGKINALDITWIRRFTAGNEKNIGKINTPIAVIDK